MHDHVTDVLIILGSRTLTASVFSKPLDKSHNIYRTKTVKPSSHMNTQDKTGVVIPKLTSKCILFNKQGKLQKSDNKEEEWR